MSKDKSNDSKKWFTKGGMIVSLLSLFGIICLAIIGYDHQVKVMASGGEFDKFSAGTILLFSLLMIFIIANNFRKFRD